MTNERIKSIFFSLLTLNLVKISDIMNVNLKITGLCSLAAISAFPLTAKENTRPNIILIMSDDMGYSDIGCYGGVIRTPNLDRLAQEGVKYTQFYNMGRSCPTRACLLTGLYPHQAGIGHMMNDRGQDGYRGDLNRNCVTLGEVMRSAGYATFVSGKWHVTKHVKPEGPKDNWPLQRGFDRFYGIIHGGSSYYDPYTLTRDNEFITPLTDPEYKPERYYFTDAITDNAIRFIDDMKDENRPYFLYMAYTAAHWPMQAFEEDIAEYDGVFDKGWDAIRQEKHDRMVSMGLMDPNWDPGVTSDDKITPWDKLSPEDQRWEAHRMAVYAAMVTRMDKNIGKLIDYLKKSGTLDNTVIFFLEDNGGCAEDFLSQGKIRMTNFPDGTSVEPMTDDEFVPQMIPYKNREGKEIWQGKGLMMGADTTWGSYGKAWANVSNYPFRMYKHWVHEGGISTPMIVHWGNGIKKAGQVRTQPAHLIDIMATCVELAEAPYPTRYNGYEIKPMEGVSLVPTFNSDKPLDREAIYFEHEGNRAVRMGKWKLVSRAPYGNWIPDPAGKWELYDMEADRTEMHDLSAQYPELVEKMSAMFEAYAKRANVYPLPKNRY